MRVALFLMLPSFYFRRPCCVDLGRATMGVLAKIHSRIVILLKLQRRTSTSGQYRLKYSTGGAELLAYTTNQPIQKPTRWLADTFCNPFSFPHNPLLIWHYRYFPKRRPLWRQYDVSFLRASDQSWGFVIMLLYKTPLHVLFISYEPNVFIQLTKASKMLLLQKRKIYHA